MNNNKFNINLNILVILFSFLITIGYANFNISKYDKNLINQEGKKYHVMIKHDVFRYFSHGDEIKEDIYIINGASKKDTGSAEGQISLFTYRINHLSLHLKKTDFVKLIIWFP